jgi:hypothetical protein
MKLEFPNIHGNDVVYMHCLRTICGDTAGKSMIDLCCNLAPHTPLLGFTDRVYIDILPRILDHKEEQKHFLQMDVLKINERPFLSSVDVTICSDGIEHFTKDNGFLLKEKMEAVSKRQVLFTPLGEYMVDHVSTDPEGHHSGWRPEDLSGYASIVFPEYHPTLGVGAFFAWKCDNIEEDFERVKFALTAVKELK